MSEAFSPFDQSKSGGGIHDGSGTSFLDSKAAVNMATENQCPWPVPIVEMTKKWAIANVIPSM